MPSELLTLHDVEARMKIVMEFFGNDTTRFSIHLSNYLNKYMKRYRAHIADKDKNEAKQGEEKKSAPEKVTTRMESAKALAAPGHDCVMKAVTSAFEKDKNFDLMALLKSSHHFTGDTLLEAQRVRRSSVLGGLSSTISSGDGRKLSAIEKNSLFVDAAVKLADTEEAEDLALEDDWEQEAFNAGDEIIVVEGENCGLFGTLQHATGGIFGVFDPAVKEDDEGNYGVDVHVSPDTDEGFWIHPEAMQHKKYCAGDEVKVIDGINIGRFGTIQSDGQRIRMDDGSYGVDVTMDDGQIEGYWIHPTSMVLKNPAAKKEEKDEDLDLEELDKYEFLPYIAFPDDEMDEALAEALNTFEIDINIRRIVAQSGKVVYRFGGKRYLVRYIHGVLLVKEAGVWNELVPILRKLAGMPSE